MNGKYAGRNFLEHFKEIAVFRHNYYIKKKPQNQ